MRKASYIVRNLMCKPYNPLYIPFSRLLPILDIVTRKTQNDKNLFMQGTKARQLYENREKKRNINACLTLFSFFTTLLGKNNQNGLAPTQSQAKSKFIYNGVGSSSYNSYVN